MVGTIGAVDLNRFMAHTYQPTTVLNQTTVIVKPFVLVHAIRVETPIWRPFWGL